MSDAQPEPVVQREDRDLSSDYRAPTTALETELTRIWIECLKVDRIGVDDDFFELGGHSLRAADLLVTTERAMGVHVPAATLYLQPTIAELAEAIERLRAAGS